MLKVADASVRPATGLSPDIGDSSEILQTRTTVVGRTYSFSMWVWVDSTDNTASGHTQFCQQKDLNGILIIRNTVEDDYSDPEAFEALVCPSMEFANQWQLVTGEYTATSNSTTFALHSEGTQSAYFDKLEIVDPYDRDVNSRNRPSTGSVSITVYGSGFAGADATVMTRSSGTAAEATLWIADTACLSRIPAGIISTHTSVMSIEGWVNTLTEQVSFDVPVLSPQIQNRAKLSPLVVTTVGSDFGIEAATYKLRKGFTGVERTGWISDTSLTW